MQEYRRRRAGVVFMEDLFGPANEWGDQRSESIANKNGIVHLTKKFSEFFENDVVSSVKNESTCYVKDGF